MAELVSLSDYAKRRGVSAKAVSKAVATARLRESVVRDERGQPKIVDVELADREWEENTRRRVDQPAESPRPPRESLGKPPDYMESRAWREAAAARREATLADQAALDLAERRGELVSAAKARNDLIDRYTLVKTRLLGVPARLVQQLPHLAAEVVPVLDELLKEALEEIADEARDEEGDGEATDT